MSTAVLAASGGLILIFEIVGLLSVERGGMEYQWAQLGAWFGGAILAVAVLKQVFWDNQNWGKPK